jgi:hypothetical protein
MATPRPSLFAAAVLIWLPRGEDPDIRDFDPALVQPPPTPNPQAWWVLHEAVTHAVTLQQKHNKVPWIKTGEQVLTPEEITEALHEHGRCERVGERQRLAQGVASGV